AAHQGAAWPSQDVPVTLKTAGSQTISASETDCGNTISGSTTVTVNPAAADHLAFGQQPTNTPAGTTISPAVTVRIVDPYNNLTNSTASVSLAMGSNPSGGPLTGPTPQAAVAGVATFSDLSIDKKGIGYTLLATTSGLTGATSNAFNITGAPATHFSVVASMDPVTAGSAFSVTVTALDGNNNVVSDYTGTVHFTSSDSGSGRVLPADYT